MRTVGTSRETRWPLIRKAGIELLYRHGFEGMNLRELSRNAGLKAGSLYNYFDSKEDFLFRILCEIMNEILDDLEKHLGPIEGAEERILAFVEFHICWHTGRRAETFVSRMEMRSLSPDHYKLYVGLRKKYERYVMDVISDGCKGGEFLISDVHVATQSIITMLTGASSWYHLDKKVSQSQLIVMHQKMVLAMLRSDPIEVRWNNRIADGRGTPLLPDPVDASRA